MKIAFIAVKGIPIGGGIEKLTEEIGSRLVEKGHDVMVCDKKIPVVIKRKAFLNLQYNDTI